MSKCSSSVTCGAKLAALLLALAVPAWTQTRSAYDRSTAIDKTSFVSWFPFICSSVPSLLRSMKWKSRRSAENRTSRMPSFVERTSLTN